MKREVEGRVTRRGEVTFFTNFLADVEDGGERITRKTGVPNRLSRK